MNQLTVEAEDATEMGAATINHGINFAPLVSQQPTPSTLGRKRLGW